MMVVRIVVSVKHTARAAGISPPRHPFADDRAVGQFGVFVRRPQFDHRLVVGVIANPAAPFNLRARAADQEKAKTEFQTQKPWDRFPTQTGISGTTLHVSKMLSRTPYCNDERPDRKKGIPVRRQTRYRDCASRKRQRTAALQELSHSPGRQGRAPAFGLRQSSGAFAGTPSAFASVHALGCAAS